jgi:hypothetical protein
MNGLPMGVIAKQLGHADTCMTEKHYANLGPNYLEASAPFGHWQTMTFIAALRHDRISAPWVIDGPINGKLFTLYVEKVLASIPGKGRDRHPRQPRQPQGQASPQRHPRQRRTSILSAALQPRPQSDRAGLCQA